MPNKSKKRAANVLCSGNSARELMRMSNISLWIESYDDIFSDFDPRPYAEKALSVDFLDETRRASRDKLFGTIDLNLMVDRKKRNVREEGIIRRRLRDHFTKHFAMLQKERKAIIRKGLLFVLSGLIFMIITTYILFRSDGKSFLTDFLIILLEPAGWFLFWEGLDLVIFESKKIKPELDFYMKMSKCRIEFISY